MLVTLAHCTPGRASYALRAAALCLPLLVSGAARADDPFEGGADALAVKDSDGSSSLRAKLKMTKLDPDMIQVQVVALDDSKYPNCTFTGKVTMPAQSKEKQFKLIGAAKVYRFAPVLKMKKKVVDLKDQLTQNNLGACYYPPGTKLVVKVSGVDRKAGAFTAAAIYLK
jgi:hypothetical protein